ncbi:MAG: hypothetical protein NTW28_01485, partial [Candidatus Solibacter sp.]|nr:hypothetical protein [Candidatus Solibacter sp.]
MGTRIAVIVLATAGWVSATELRPETRAAFDRYVRQAESRIEAQVRGGDGFLFATSEERRAVLRGETVLTESKVPRGEFKVTGGLIHDWAGAVFIPGASLRGVLDLVQAYDRHKEYYSPEVVDSRLLSRTGGDFEVGLRLLKKKVLTVVLDTQHAVHYESRDARRWWSRSRSTRIVEIRDAGKVSEKPLPSDTGHGFLWRVNSYWTFQELDGGTYVECEAISLTRNVPAG